MVQITINELSICQQTVAAFRSNYKINLISRKKGEHTPKTSRKRPDFSLLLNIMAVSDALICEKFSVTFFLTETKDIKWQILATLKKFKIINCSLYRL